MNLGVLGTKKVPRKRFKALPVLAVSESQSAQARRSLRNRGRAPPFLTGPPHGQCIWVDWTTLVLVITSNSFNGTLHETLGRVRIGVLLWIAGLHAIALNHLGARGVDLNSTEAYGLHAIA